MGGMGGIRAVKHPESQCLDNSDMRLNVLLHDRHEYFFTSEWVWRCARKLDLSANARLQCWQENGFSPVCVRMWPWSSHGRLNALPHSLQMHGKVCVRMCILSAPSVLYALSQYLQQNVLATIKHRSSAQWCCWCLVSPDAVEYVLVHDGHLNRPAATAAALRLAPPATAADTVGDPDGCDDGGGRRDSPLSIAAAAPVDTTTEQCIGWYGTAGGGGGRGQCICAYGGETPVDEVEEQDDGIGNGTAYGGGRRLWCSGGDALRTSVPDGDQPPCLPYHGSNAGGLSDDVVATDPGEVCSGLNAEPALPDGDSDVSRPALITMDCGYPAEATAE